MRLYSEVTLDLSWQKQRPAERVMTGAMRRAVVLGSKAGTPLGIADAVLLSKQPDLIPEGWRNHAYITFDRDVMKLPDGRAVVPCLRRFSTDKNFWLDWEDLSWLTTVGPSAVWPA